MIPQNLPKVPDYGYRYEDNRVWRSLTQMPGWLHNKIALYFVGLDVSNEGVIEGAKFSPERPFIDPRAAPVLCDLVELPEKATAPIASTPDVTCDACKGKRGETCNLGHFHDCRECYGLVENEGSDGTPGHRVFLGSDGRETILADWLADSVAGLKLKSIGYPGDGKTYNAVGAFDEVGDMVAVIMPVNA